RRWGGSGRVSHITEECSILAFLSERYVAEFLVAASAAGGDSGKRRDDPSRYGLIRSFWLPVPQGRFQLPACRFALADQILKTTRPLLDSGRAQEFREVFTQDQRFVGGFKVRVLRIGAPTGLCNRLESVVRVLDGEHRLRQWREQGNLAKLDFQVMEHSVI